MPLGRLALISHEVISPGPLSCAISGISRTAYYYEPKRVDDDEIIDLFEQLLMEEIGGGTEVVRGDWY